MSLNDVATVSVTGAGPAITPVGFGTALILAYFTHWTDELTHTYDTSSALDTLIDEGFTVGEPVYKAMQAFCAQDPKPASVKVGRLTSALTQLLEFTPTVLNTTEYHVTVYRDDTSETVTASYTSDGSATAAEIATGLASAIGSAITGLTASNATGVLHLAMTAGLSCHVKNWSSNLALVETTADATLATQLAAIRNQDDDWYFLGLADTAGKLPQKAASDYIETLDKEMILRTSEDRAMGSGSNGDIGETLKAATQGRTSGVFCLQDTGNFRDFAALGERLWSDPGSDTWAFKTYKSNAFDALTPNQQTNLRAKNYMVFVKIAGVNVSLDGKVFGGEYIDVVRFIDWLKINMQLDIFQLQIANQKMGYTQDGINAVESKVKGRLKLGQDAGGLSTDEAPTTTAPKVGTVTLSDKQQRVLNGVKFKAKLAGAIHLVHVTGNISP